MCRVLGASTSGYYAWRSRTPPKRDQDDERLREPIRQIHQVSYGTYGAPRIHAELRDRDVYVGGKRVARLMRGAGLVGVSRRKGVPATRRRSDAEPAADLVERDFSARAPNEPWVADITYVPSGEGFLYLSVVVDVFSRRVVGWAMADHLKSASVLRALEMALSQRRAHGVIHHWDQGCHYTSFAFGQRCRAAGVRPSMGSVGDCYDNALCESFFATRECELLDRERFVTREQARLALFQYIEGWYNPRRRPSALGYKSPVEFERIDEWELSRYEEVCGYASGVILSRRGRSSPVELTSCGEILRRSAPRKRDLRPQDEIQDPRKHTPTCLAAESR